MNHPVERLLDTDLYKLTMMQFVLHQFPDVHVKYKFKCRNEGIDLSVIKDRVQNEIHYLSKLSFKDTDLFYLRSLGFFRDDFIQFLRLFKLNSNYVKVTTDDTNLNIIVDGPWLHTILYEIYILKIVNQLYFEYNYPFIGNLKTQGKKRFKDKLEKVKGTKVKFADFGTRRAYSRSWHESLMKDLSFCPNCVGTSNVLYAMQYNMKPIGTMAHEVFQIMQALTRLEDSQSYTLQKWADEYRGELGIALTDTLGISKFLYDFDLYFAKLFDGVRHDSGCPYEWVDKVIQHYYKLGIDPETKTAVFSDGLTFDDMIKIKEYVGYQMRVSFGIGTNLTNDLGPEPLNIVMKVIEANGQPVAKLSDTPGKEMCEDNNYITYLKKVVYDSSQ